ncbi:hypothetical protein PIB30_114653 [Stylosanthes scabra]|uniref:Uncharacterized protein n=1 Tax=Stylosanthes scabra TaxID=79078 RepID=A0ABU6U0L8_9FABA|nr:hypothetical protein [Stylosanthes scabra]
MLKVAEDAVKETEAALKEQILVLAPNFDVSLLGAFKEVVDGQIVDPPPVVRIRRAVFCPGRILILYFLNSCSKESVVPCLTGSDFLFVKNKVLLSDLDVFCLGRIGFE